TDALCRLAGPHHEMLDEELATAVEQLGQSHLSVAPVEDVFLLDPDPGQGSAVGAQLIPQSRQLLFLCEQLLSRLEPLVSRHDSVRLHGALSFHRLTSGGLTARRKSLASHG